MGAVLSLYKTQRELEEAEKSPRADFRTAAALTPFRKIKKPGRPQPVNTDEANKLFLRGVECEIAGAPKKAITAYRRSLKMDPNLAESAVNLGTIYLRDIYHRNLKLAEKYYLQAVRIDPEYPIARFNLANYYDEKGYSVEAIEQYNETIRLDPEYVDAHYNLAIVLEAQKQKMQAISHWKAVVEFSTDTETSAGAQKELHRLLKRIVHSAPGQREPAA